MSCSSALLLFLKLLFSSDPLPAAATAGSITVRVGVRTEGKVIVVVFFLFLLSSVEDEDRKLLTGAFFTQRKDPNGEKVIGFLLSRCILVNKGTSHTGRDGITH